VWSKLDTEFEILRVVSYYDLFNDHSLLVVVNSRCPSYHLLNISDARRPKRARKRKEEERKKRRRKEERLHDD
jgi:hypothetical protein